jgi:hypothetical protein
MYADTITIMTRHKKEKKKERGPIKMEYSDEIIS